MSNSSKFVANSIEQILLGLARGLRDAQTVLDELPTTDAFGQPQSSYHLPYLDFNIKATVAASLSAEATTPTRSASIRQQHAIKARSIPLIRLTLPDLKKDAGNAPGTTELVSTFSGRLVSIPPSNALPVPRLAARILIDNPDEPGQQTLLATLSNSAGELLDGAAVELNLDVDSSLQLSTAAGVKNLTEEQLRDGLQLTTRVLITDQQGSASCQLTLDNQLPANTQFLLLINSGPTLTQLILTL